VFGTKEKSRVVVSSPTIQTEPYLNDIKVLLDKSQVSLSGGRSKWQFHASIKKNFHLSIKQRFYSWVPSYPLL